jgi:hypothetical protein
MSVIPEQGTPQARARTLKARRIRRFQYFQLEILKRLGGNPPFTDEERQQLALLIWPRTGAR